MPALINEPAHLPRAGRVLPDDDHVIAWPAIQQVIAALVRHLPSPLCLLLITRIDAARPLPARRRARQRLVETRAADSRVALPLARSVIAMSLVIGLWFSYQGVADLIG